VIGSSPFTRLPLSQMEERSPHQPQLNGSTRSSSARIKTQTVLGRRPRLQPMLFWALTRPQVQITMRKVDGWQSLTQKLADKPIDLAA